MGAQFRFGCLERGVRSSRSRIKSNYNDFLERNEIFQLEKWTKKKIVGTIFDSMKNEFLINSSEFCDIMNEKSHLLFVVEDTKNNKFGYYFNGTIKIKKIFDNSYNTFLNKQFELLSRPFYVHQTNSAEGFIKYFSDYYNGVVEIDEKFHKDDGSFLFSLKSNGRLNGMYKFEEKIGSKGLIICDNIRPLLFGIHGGFYIFKENQIESSYVWEASNLFDYHGTTKAFHENLVDGDYKGFTPKRFMVIQMN